MKRAGDELLQNFAKRPKQEFCLPITEEVYTIFQQAIAQQQTEQALNLLWGINPNSIINGGEHYGVNSLILLLSIGNVSAEIIKLYEAIINYPAFNLNAKFNLKNFFKGTIFTIAAANGCAWLVTLLLADSRINLGAHDNDAIRRAAYEGHTEVVKLLLADSRVNPEADYNYAIRMAAYNGHTEVVKLLMENKAVNSNMDYNVLGKIALDKKNNNLYATLESSNPVHKGLLTVWAGRKDLGSIISILAEETMKEEIIQKIILIQKHLIAKTIS